MGNIRIIGKDSLEEHVWREQVPFENKIMGHVTIWQTISWSGKIMRQLQLNLSILMSTVRLMFVINNLIQTFVSFSH